MNFDLILNKRLFDDRFPRCKRVCFCVSCLFIGGLIVRSFVE